MFIFLKRWKVKEGEVMNEMMIELLIKENESIPDKNNVGTFTQTFSSLLNTQNLIRDEHITRSKKRFIFKNYVEIY